MKTAIQGLMRRLTLLPEKLQTMRAAVLHELNALMCHSHEGRAQCAEGLA